ncbi:hypothetical protein SAXI111661_04895 [Saccharomonospora xinjiangensis]|nr:hypothetical protein [Saccharomonospora xinjiangensis]QBQ58962.1 hypothetical protein EYD13_02895 [Saccharomonospora xinjiangensis]
MGALIPGGGALSMAMAAMDKSMGAKAMAEVTRSADRLVESAKSGGFRVTKEGADPIIKVLEEFIERAGRLSGELDVFNQEMELGNHDYGKLVSREMWKAANDERSARAALRSLRIILEKSREALLRASGQYQEQEDQAEDTFRGMGD